MPAILCSINCTAVHEPSNARAGMSHPGMPLWEKLSTLVVIMLLVTGARRGRSHRLRAA